MVEGRYVDFELPSKGVLYENSLRMVSVRPMYTTEEKYLAGRSRDWQAVVDKLLSTSGCIKDLGGMSPLDLLSSDRLFLLFVVRMLSYGHDYTFQLRCDSCGMIFSQTIKLLEGLNITPMKEDAAEPFSITLADLGMAIGFRLLRGKDEKAIDNYTKRALQRQQEGQTRLDDPAYIHRLARHIVTIDGETVELPQAEAIVSQMTAKDSTDFRDAVDDVNGGIDLDLEIICSNCGALNEEIMPFTRDFFRPRKSRRGAHTK